MGRSIDGTPRLVSGWRFAWEPLIVSQMLHWPTLSCIPLLCLLAAQAFVFEPSIISLPTSGWSSEQWNWGLKKMMTFECMITMRHLGRIPVFCTFWWDHMILRQHRHLQPRQWSERVLWDLSPNRCEALFGYWDTDWRRLSWVSLNDITCYPSVRDNDEYKDVVTGVYPPLLY